MDLALVQFHNPCYGSRGKACAKYFRDYTERILNECGKSRMRGRYFDKQSLRHGSTNSILEESEEINSITLNIKRVQLRYIKDILKKIEKCKWSEIDQEDIVKAQDILYELLVLIKRTNRNC